MDKKELKFYETPACEVVELKSSVALLAGSGNAEGIEEPTPDPEHDFDLD